MSETSKRALAALAALAAGLLLAACGGSGSPTTATSSAAALREDGLKFSKCMREHGIKDFPNPETAAGSGAIIRFKSHAREIDPRTMEAAQRACRRYSPRAQIKLTPQQKVEREEAVQKFAKCMREHGIKLEASTNGGAIRIGIHRGPGSSGPNPESPAFQAAQKACRGLLPFKGARRAGLPPGAPVGGAGPHP